jgi:phosphatidylserine/phosphatidylglycerophosphate/cardiolipin synthase-like enzyme
MAITATFLQENGQSPSAVAAQLAEFLSAARSSLHVAVYDFRLGADVARDVLSALRDRAAHGVEVRIAYDAGRPTVSFQRASADPAPPGTADFVNHIGSGVATRPISGGDPNLPKLMHHKYVIRDGRTPEAVLWTGSTNFTDDSWSLQENNILCIASPELCAYYETDFEELWARGDIGTSGEHDTGRVRLPAPGSATVEVAFAPGEGRAIDHEIAHHIATARRRLKVCSMLITSGAILGALGDALHHGHVQEYNGIYDRTQMESVFDQWRGGPADWKIKAFEQVSAGLAFKRSIPYRPGGTHNFMHNKAVVADDCVITGSYNLSHSATANAENVVMVHDPELADRYATYIDALARRYGKPA